MRTFFIFLLAVLTLSAGAQDSLFLNTETPSRPEEDNAVELGMVFIPQADGVITHFRIYKTEAADASLFTLNLWTVSNKKNLVRQTLRATGQSGWLRIPLTAPLPVQYGVAYVVSAHYAGGRYGGRTGFFQTSRRRGNLLAPASNQAGGNGRYVYGSKTAFPSSTYQQSAYYIDVVMMSPRKTLIVNAGKDTVLVSPIDSFGPGDYQLHGFVSGDDVTYTWSKEQPLGLDDTMLNANTLTPTLRGLAAVPHIYVLGGVDKWGTVSEHKVTVDVIVNPKQIVITLTRNGQPYLEIFQDGSWRNVVDGSTGFWYFKGITNKGFEGDVSGDEPH